MTSQDLPSAQFRRDEGVERVASQVGDASRAIRSTQRAAEEALDRLSDRVEDLRSQAAPLIDSVARRAEEAARRGTEAVRDTSQQLRQRAVQVEAQSASAFPNTYSDFAASLRELSSDVPLLSPKRFSEALNIDLQTLADQARVHRNTVARAPGARALQDFIREALRVIKAATDLNGDLRRALFWYRTEPLALFGYRTAERLVAEGRADDVLAYVASLEAGAAG